MEKMLYGDKAERDENDSVLDDGRSKELRTAPFHTVAG